MSHAQQMRNMILSQTLFGDENTSLTIQDYEDLLIEVTKLRRENKKLKKELEEYKLYENDYIA